MSDIADELRALTADIREHLTNAMLAGSLLLPTDLPLPAGETIEEITPPTPAAATASPVAARWAALAADAREQATVIAETGTEGLRRVREDLGDCRRCGLCTSRRQIVYGVGDSDADLLIIGEGPGHDEDLKGEPIVGPAGQMLDKMLENVLKLQRPQVYIATVVMCRPPGNRTPLADEVGACRPFLERQIRAVRPKVILVLGSVALKALVRAEAGVMRQRGQWLDWEGTPVMPTFDPNHLLRNPDDKRKTFDDLKVLRALYDERGGRR